MPVSCLGCQVLNAATSKRDSKADRKFALRGVSVMGYTPVADLGPSPGYNIDPSMNLRFGINEGVPFHKRAFIDPGFGDVTPMEMPEVVPGQSGLIWGAAILGGLLAIGGLVWRYYAVHEAATTASKFARR